MKIKVLKSKIHNVQIDKGVIINDGSIGLPEYLMGAANIVENELVQVIGTKNNHTNMLFVKKTENDVIVPLDVAAIHSIITINSIGTATVDEPVKEPIIVDYDSTDS